MGAGDLSLANHAAVQAFTLSGTLSLVMAGFGVLFTEFLLRLLGLSEGVIAEGANYMRWHMGTGKLEAQGNVVVRDTGTQVYGQRLVSDTRLRRGRLTGGTRIHMQKMPVKVKNG